MRVALRVALLVTASLGLLGFSASVASAAGVLVSQTTGGIATPVTQDASIRGPASLTLSWDSNYDGTPPLVPKMTVALWNLDDDFLITPGTTAQCDPSAVANSTTEAAIAACPGAYLGTGRFTLDGTVAGVHGITTTFNATPGPGDVPRVMIHVRSTASTTTLILGDLTSSTTFADYFQRLEFGVPILPLGFVIDHLDFRIGEPGSPSASTYFTARCADSATAWDYNAGWAFDDATNRTDSHAQKCSVAPPAPPPPAAPAVVTTPPVTTAPAKKKSSAKAKDKARKKKRKKK